MILCLYVVALQVWTYVKCPQTQINYPQEGYTLFQKKVSIIYIARNVLEIIIKGIQQDDISFTTPKVYMKHKGTLAPTF